MTRLCTHFTKLNDRSFFVRVTLTCIADYVSETSGIEGITVGTEHNIRYHIPAKNVTVLSKVDQIIYLSRANGTKKYIVVVECKRWNVDDGIQQCCLGMKACFDANKDDRTVFGFCTVAERWNFLTYDKLNGFKLMVAVDVMFPEIYRISKFGSKTTRMSLLPCYATMPHSEMVWWLKTQSFVFISKLLEV